MPNKWMKPTAACGGCSLSIGRYAAPEPTVFANVHGESLPLKQDFPEWAR